MSEKIVITGGGGYIGSRLLTRLSCMDFDVLSLVREGHRADFDNDNITYKHIDNLLNIAEYPEYLSGVECVIHLAGRAHILRDSCSDPLSEFVRVNCDITLNLALESAALGVKRFVYISSVGVLGGSTSKGDVFNNDSEYAPENAYAISKMKAEIGLRQISESTDMEIAIVRPPLVYGANAPGNFYRLLRLVDLGIPLPLGSMNAKKSMISLDNLCDLIIKTIRMPLPKFSPLVVSDGSEWSTSELVTLIAGHMGKKPYLFSVSIPILTFFASLIGKKEEVYKLSTPLQVDANKTIRMLNWQPGQSPEDGLREAVRHYLAHRK